MLLGVVVRARRKRSMDSSGISSKSSKVAKTSSRSTPPAVSTSSPGVNYIPTARSSKRKEGGAAAHRSGNGTKHPAVADAAAASTTVKDVAEDLPYSPGQLLNDSDAVNGASLNRTWRLLTRLP